MHILRLAKALSHKIPVLLALSTVAILLGVSVFGLIHLTNEMRVNNNGTMSGCLFDGKAEICTMTFMEHLGAWQSVLTTLPPKVGLMSVLLSAIVLLGVAVVLRNRLLVDHAELSFSRQRLYIKQNSYIPFFNPLREAFSQGILNPKIYESVAIL